MSNRDIAGRGIKGSSLCCAVLDLVGVGGDLFMPQMTLIGNSKYQKDRVRDIKQNEVKFSAMKELCP